MNNMIDTLNDMFKEMYESDLTEMYGIRALERMLNFNPKHMEMLKWGLEDITESKYNRMIPGSNKETKAICNILELEIEAYIESLSNDK